MLIAGTRELTTRPSRCSSRSRSPSPCSTQFYVVYQPIVDLATGEMRGVEALLRWQAPGRRPVPPDVFIPMAEHGGSIQVLGWYVLDQACASSARWTAESPRAPARRRRQRLGPPARRAGFAQRVFALVASHGVAPDQVVLELTEQALASTSRPPSPSSRSCAPGRCRWPWTTTAPATPRCATSTASTRTWSRSTAASSPTWWTACTRRRSSAPSCTWPSPSTSSRSPRASRPPSSSADRPRPRLRAGAGLPLLPAGAARGDHPDARGRRARLRRSRRARHARAGLTGQVSEPGSAGTSTACWRSHDMGTTSRARSLVEASTTGATAPSW